MSQYFAQTKYVSNSDLGSLQRAMQQRDVVLQGSFLKFGNLVDAKFTEAEKVHEMEATEEEWALADRMHEAGMADPTLRFYFERSKMQHEVYKERFEVSYDGDVVLMPVRCKFDFLCSPLRSAADLKTTACTSQESFRKSIEWLNYDRAAAWYMDIKGLDSFMLIGIGKKPERFTKRHPVFKYAIQRGDSTYLEGRRKYSFLAYYYYFLIYNLQL